MLSVFIGISLIVQAPPPEIHAVHFIHGDVPSIIVTGRNLWVETEGWSQAGKANKISINGTEGTWDALTGASGHDTNRGLYCIQRAWFRTGLPATSNAAVKLTRWDDVSTTYNTFIPVNRGRSEFTNFGTTRVISEPIIVTDSQTLDLEGATVVPGPGFVGTEILRYGLGSGVKNGRIIIPESSNCPATAIMRANNPRINIPWSLGIHVTGMEFHDLRYRGQGVVSRGFRGCFFAHCKFNAWLCIEREPMDDSCQNIFYDCEFTCPRGRNDGQIGNALCGQQNLIWQCSWHDIDRGPTGGCFGPPLEKTTWWECDQYRTGTSQGASEGLLYESMECAQATARFDGTVATVTGLSANSNQNQIRPGYFVVRPDGRWARITEMDRQSNSPTFTLKLHRPISNNQPGDSLGDVRIGNAIIENNFLRCRFDDGKSGIYFWGCAIDNYLGGCQFSNLRAAIVQKKSRDNEGWSFGWNLIDRLSVYRNVVEQRVEIPNSVNWPPEAK
ncbi:hypothetical protein EBZ39_03120 [bacterium]|nr:hypothetical protein [bacterium]